MSINSPNQFVLRGSSHEQPALSTFQRVSLSVLGLLMLAGFGLALSLTPSRTGRGTHQQLGLPPCTILSLTNTPCPACGMTTSFSHFVRGQWASAIRVNTSGFLLACGCVLFLPWSAVTAIRGRVWLLRRVDLWILWLLTGWMILVFLEWGWRNCLPSW